MSYFSDRELGPRPRVQVEISAPLWAGIVAQVERRIVHGEFAMRHPDECPDGRGPCGTDRSSMGDAVLAEIPQLAEAILIRPSRWGETDEGRGWPLDPERVPPTLAILDLIEFCYAAVAHPSKRSLHSFFGHDDLSGFDVAAGRGSLRDDINRLFGRNEMAYEVTESGKVIRLGTPVLTDTVRLAMFNSGDSALDELLERARAKYLSVDPSVRAESLEQLWDALERTKTLRPGDKKASSTSLIAEVATSDEMESILQAEAKALTSIGNVFRIRHHETNKLPVALGDVDYLFHRAFALIAQLGAPGGWPGSPGRNSR